MALTILLHTWRPTGTVQALLSQCADGYPSKRGITMSVQRLLPSLSVTRANSPILSSAKREAERATLGVLITVLTLLTPSVGIAEGFADVYLGGGSTVATHNTFQVNGNIVRHLERSGTSQLFGGRLGYWFENYPYLGLALDTAVSTPKFSDIGPPQSMSPVTLSVAPISPLAMVRLPLGQSEEFPKGRFQPYVAAGPALVFTALSVFAGKTVGSPAVLEDSSMSLGFDLRGGIVTFLTKNFGIFVEYRYLQVHPTLESNTGSGVVQYRPTFQTNAGVVGITYRFGWQ